MVVDVIPVTSATWFSICSGSVPSLILTVGTSPVIVQEIWKSLPTRVTVAETTEPEGFAASAKKLGLFPGAVALTPLLRVKTTPKHKATSLKRRLICIAFSLSLSDELVVNVTERNESPPCQGSEKSL